MGWHFRHSSLYRYKWHHALFWTVYGLFWFAVGQLFTPPSQRGLTRETIIMNLIYLGTNMGASYISVYVLLPYLLVKKRLLLYISLLIADILLFAGLIALGFYLLFRRDPEALDRIFQLQTIIPATVFSVATAVGVWNGLKIFQIKRDTERANKKLQKNAVEAELSYLTGQVNPHFLFNAINNIYFLIKRDKELAADMLLRFSELLRYQLYDGSPARADIEQEIAYLRNYIALEKLRKSNVDVTFDVIPEDMRFKIAPLLFIPFIENAFKYVSTQAGMKNFVYIKIGYLGPSCIFEVSNSFDPAGRSDMNRGGIGIGNVRRRLDLLYPDAYELSITESGRVFDVRLKLDTSYED